MLNYLAIRLLSTLPVMAVVAVFVFSLLRLAPGDPAAVIAGDYATVEDVARIRERLGLDQPLPQQFLKWLGLLLSADLGVSIFTNIPVARLIAQRVEPTLSLALITLVLTMVTAIPIGILAAWRAGTWIDKLITGFTVFAFSVPTFVVGYALIYGLAVQAGLFPVQGYVSIRQGFWPFFERLVLPSLTLSGVYIALITRMTRATMIEVLGQDYIRTARAKGLGTGTVLFLHALKNAAIPIVTTVGNGVALLISGAVITETVFSIPGLGRLIVDAILRRDYPIIQGVILVFSGVYVLINLLVDLLYTALDPRIRY